MAATGCRWHEIQNVVARDVAATFKHKQKFTRSQDCCIVACLSPALMFITRNKVTPKVQNLIHIVNVISETILWSEIKGQLKVI